MNLFSTFKLFIPKRNNKVANIEIERIIVLLLIMFFPIASGNLLTFDDSCNVSKLKILNDKGTNVNVNTNTTKIPTVIIFPNSRTGFMSPEISDKNATPVVKTANKQGINI